MTDTAQPGLAAENVELGIAADAFKSFLDPQPAQQRDDQGRFAPSDAAEPEDEEDDAGELPADDDIDEQIDDGEAADEAQPDPTDMPSSWSKEDADLWASLPAEAQAKIAEREAQRDQGLNTKLQEAANARKAGEAQLAEANANRDSYAKAIDTVLSLVQPQQPNPYDYGLGTQAFDRDSYEHAKFQYDQQAAIITQLTQQRETISAQQAEEAQEAARARHQEIEEAWFPRLVADVPDLTDPAKSAETVNSIIRFAVDNGIPQEAFSSAEAVNSAEMRIAWMAMQYARQETAKGRVKAGNPPPKPASPAVKPGGITPRKTIQAGRLNKAQSRLAQEGTVEAGAAVFKHFLKG